MEEDVEVEADADAHNKFIEIYCTLVNCFDILVIVLPSTRSNSGIRDV